MDGTQAAENQKIAHAYGEIMASVLPGYVWLKDFNRFRDMETGRFVSRQTINDITRSQTSEAEARYHELHTALHEGRISAASFVERMREESRRNMLQNIALAKGGFDRLDFSDFGRAGQALRNQYAQFAGTAQDVADGKVSLPQLLQRANGYAGEARRQYYIADRDQRQPSDADHVIIGRRTLGDAQHCAECLQYYQQGWVLASEVVLPGILCSCDTHCKCDVLYREVPRSELQQWLGTKR